MANLPRVGIPEREQGAAGAQRKAPGSAQGPRHGPGAQPPAAGPSGPRGAAQGRPGDGRAPPGPLRCPEAAPGPAVSGITSGGAPGPGRGRGAGGSRAQARRSPGHGRCRRGCSAGRASAPSRPSRGWGAPLRAPGSGPAGAGRAPGPSVRPGGVQSVGRAAVGGSRLPAGRSPSMSLVTVLKCIFGGRLAGPAGALRPPRRSSSAPFPARSAAAATEIREAILKAFALGDRGLFSSIGETPMQERQPRQPPTTSPPLPPLTPLLSSAPSREVRAGPPLLPHRGEGS